MRRMARGIAAAAMLMVSEARRRAHGPRPITPRPLDAHLLDRARHPPAEFARLASLWADELKQCRVAACYDAPAGAHFIDLMRVLPPAPIRPRTLEVAMERGGAAIVHLRPKAPSFRPKPRQLAKAA